MAGQADHPDVVAEVFATELGSDTEPPGHLQNPLLPVEVAKAVPGFAAACRQVVQVVGRGVLGRAKGVFGRRATDDHRKVVWRAGRGAQGAQLLVQEGGQPLGVEEGLSLLEEVALVGRTAALGHEQKLVGVAGH